MLHGRWEELGVQPRFSKCGGTEVCAEGEPGVSEVYIHTVHNVIYVCTVLFEVGPEITHAANIFEHQN